MNPLGTQTEEPSGQRDDRSKRVIAALSVATAVLTFATALLGFLTAQESERKNAALQAADQAQKSNSALSQQLASATAALNSPRISGSSVAPLPSPSATGGAVLRTGEITLTDGYCVDLESTAPDWDVTSDGACYSSKYDIFNVGTTQSIINQDANGGFAPLDKASSLSYSTCASATNWVHGLNYSDIFVGENICMRTADGNHALAQVSNISNGTLSIHVTVWSG